MYSYGGFGPSANRTSYAWPNTAPANAGPQVISLTKAQIEFKNHMRLLWEQHVAWTRMAITSLVFGLPDTDVVLARLLQNPTDMGNALKPFYGESIANAYANLIKEHLLIAADLVKAAKAGDTNAVAAAEKNGLPMRIKLLNSLPVLIHIFQKRRSGKCSIRTWLWLKQKQYRC